MRTAYLTTAISYTALKGDHLTGIFVEGSGGGALEVSTAAAAGSVTPIIRFGSAIGAIMFIPLSLDLVEGQVVRCFGTSASAVLYLR